MLKRIAIVVALLIGGGLAAGPHPALAHAVIVAAAPSAGSIVSGPDVVVELQFNARLDRQRSRLTLTLPDGSDRPIEVDVAAPVQVLTGRATMLLPGKYVVKWQVLAVDGHITRGQIPFIVGE